MVEPHSSNFRVIRTNFLAVQIFRKFTVCIIFFQLYNEENIRAVVTLNEDWELEEFSNSEEVGTMKIK